MTRRGVFTAAALLMASASAARAAPASAGSWLAYESRLRARLADAGGGRFEPDFAHALLSQTNGFRASERLSAYQWDEGLAACARAHAADMASRDYFAHESPEGFTHLDRVSLLTRDLCGATVENIAWRDYPTTASTPQQFEDLWENSPGHRKNLLRDGYTSAGYGVVKVGSAYYAAGVYADASVRLARPLPLKFGADSQLISAVQGASPVIERMAFTPPFKDPTWISTPDGKMPALQPGIWQLRPMRATAAHKFDVLTGPMFFVG